MPGVMTSFIPGSPRRVPGWFPLPAYRHEAASHTSALLPHPIWTVGSSLSFLLPWPYFVPLSLGVETGFCVCVCV